MSQHAHARWLVTYDIADPKRLARVFRYLKKQGVPVQYSVFLVAASAVQIKSLINDLAQLVSADADDVRAYRIPQKPWQATLGSSILPTDAMPGGELQL